MQTLTQKEMMLLKDEKAQEDLCIKKYTKYINEAQDPELKQLFSNGPMSIPWTQKVELFSPCITYTERVIS